jgi:hypothetical protein
MSEVSSLADCSCIVMQCPFQYYYQLHESELRWIQTRCVGGDSSSRGSTARLVQVRVDDFVTVAMRGLPACLVYKVNCGGAENLIILGHNSLTSTRDAMHEARM